MPLELPDPPVEAPLAAGEVGAVEDVDVAPVPAAGDGALYVVVEPTEIAPDTCRELARPPVTDRPLLFFAAAVRGCARRPADRRRVLDVP